MNPSTLRTAPISSPSLSVVNTLSIEAELPNRRKSDPSDIPAQERVLQNDPRWRKYSISVEKTLQSFDNVNEWADFITFLAKLLKVCLLWLFFFREFYHKWYRYQSNRADLNLLHSIVSAKLYNVSNYTT